MSRRLGAAAATLLLAACVPLTPYDEVASRLPEGSLVEVDGRRVHVARAGDGEPVLLLHGFGASAYSWRHVSAALDDAFQLIAPDLNGFGFSERPREIAAYTVAGQLRLVLGVMDALGLDSAHVAGHSYGGALAVHLAWRHPERVRSLVLVDSAGPEYPWHRRTVTAAFPPLTYLFVRARAIRREAVEIGLARSFEDDSLVTQELVDAYFDRVRIEGVSRAFRGLTAPTREPEELPEIAELELPVLLVWGSEDELVGPEAGRRIAERLPNGRFELLDGVGHIPLEESPAELARVMRSFLAALPG